MPDVIRDKTILIIAGTDGNARAGMLRDLEVAYNHGIQAKSVITAVTAQTDAKVSAIHYLPAENIRSQLLSVFENGTPDAIKIGMLGTSEALEAVAEILTDYNGPVVLDPVLSASSGTDLLAKTAIQTLTENLLPKVSLITPNIPEALVLSDLNYSDTPQKAQDICNALHKMGAQSVLLKGGHAKGAICSDCLSTGSAIHLFSTPRYANGRRGTGCTLSTAITCHLAQNSPLYDACAEAIRYTRAWIGQANIS